MSAQCKINQMIDPEPQTVMKGAWDPIFDCIRLIENKKRPYLPREMKLVQLKKKQELIMMESSLETEE